MKPYIGVCIISYNLLYANPFKASFYFTVTKLVIKVSCCERDYILDSFWIASSSGGKTASDVLMVRLEGNRLLFLLTILVNTVFILVLRKM